MPLYVACVVRMKELMQRQGVETPVMTLGLLLQSVGLFSYSGMIVKEVFRCVLTRFYSYY